MASSYTLGRVVAFLITATDLDFADDLALLSNTIQDVQSLLHDHEVAAEQVGLS